MEKRMISSESFESRGWISERYSAYGKTAVSLDDASRPLFPNIHRIARKICRTTRTSKT